MLSPHLRPPRPLLLSPHRALPPQKRRSRVATPPSGSGSAGSRNGSFRGGSSRSNCRSRNATTSPTDSGLRNGPFRDGSCRSTHRSFLRGERSHASESSTRLLRIRRSLRKTRGKRMSRSTQPSLENVTISHAERRKKITSGAKISALTLRCW